MGHCLFDSKPVIGTVKDETELAVISEIGEKNEKVPTTVSSDSLVRYQSRCCVPTVGSEFASVWSHGDCVDRSTSCAAEISIRVVIAAVTGWAIEVPTVIWS